MCQVRRSESQKEVPMELGQRWEHSKGAEVAALGWFSGASPQRGHHEVWLPWGLWFYRC